MIAIRTKSPVLPVYISRKVKPFCRTYVVVGKPFDIRERMAEASAAHPEIVLDAAKMMKDEVLKLKESLEEQCRR